MRISDRIDSQQILGVSLTLIMLLSMGSIGFIGGVGTVGAQDATGGTFNTVFDESQSVNGELNVDTGTVSLVGPDADSDGNVTDVTAESDGQIDISSPGDPGEFAGVAISPDRINATTMGASTADPATPADFLDDIPNEFAVASADGDAFPAIFIEYAPQSEFSQIEGSNGLAGVSAAANGEHDFIVIANSSDVTAITNTGATDISGNGTVALSVDNDDVSGGNLNVSNASQATVLATGSNFGSVASDLTGPDVTDLQNSNIDDIQFTAGVFGASPGDDDTIQQVLLADNIASTNFDAGPDDHGETIHHEQITLNGETSFASIAAAETVATSGDRIDVAEGSYSDLEPAELEIETNQLVISGVNDSLGADRIEPDGDLTVEESETEFNGKINATDRQDVTLENLVVSDSTAGPVISLVSGNSGNSENPQLDAVVVRATGSDTDGVELSTDSGSDNVTIQDSAIFQTNFVNETDNGRTGILFAAVNEGAVSSDNLVVGFEEQVDNDAGVDIDLTAFFNNNLFADSDLSHAAIVVDNASAAPDNIIGSNIFGSINAADDAAEDGEVIDVFNAEYREDFSNSIDTNTTAVVGDDAVDVADTSSNETVVLNSSDGDVRVESLTLIDDTGLDDSGAAAGNITIDDVVVEEGTGAITLNNTAADANVVVGNVTAEDYNGTGQFLTIGPRDLGQVSVADSDISLDDNLDDSVGGVAINTTNDTVGGVSVTNTTIDATAVAATGTPTGITVDVDGVNGDVDISTNNVINASDGLGIAYRTASGASEDGIGNDGELLVENNRVSGGEALTAMRLEPVDDRDTRTFGSVDGNVLIGTNVAAGTGLETRGTQGSNLKDLILEDPDTSDFVKSNTISGFETLINSSLSDASTFDVSQSYESQNALGTHVAPEELNQDGSLRDRSPVQGNIYGNIDSANEDLNPRNANNTVTLNVTDTNLSIDSLHGNPVPADYVHGGEQVTLDASFAEVNVEGPGGPGTDAPVVRNLSFLIEDGNDNLANHDIRDLRLNGTNDTTAIQVASVSNSQSTFERLAVTTTATGVNVSSQDDDVTVVEIRNSTFDVDDDGIVLADSPDDRDGFVIDNVELSGDNLTEDSDTGLNLSNVDTPGKEELPTELEVRGLDVFNFETQLELSEELVTNFPALDAQAVYENDSAVASLDSGDIVFANNTFSQAVFVKEAFEEPQFTTSFNNLTALDRFDDVAPIADADVVFNGTGLPATQERLADKQTIYGSITEADATGVDNAALNNATIEVVDDDGDVIPAPSNLEFNVSVDNDGDGDADDPDEFVDQVEIDVNESVQIPVDTATAIIDVRATGEDELTATERLYTENVEVGAGNTSAADELLVRGPQNGTPATDSFRGGPSNEAIVVGTLSDSRDDPTNATTDITIDGLTTVAPHEYSVIEFRTDVDRLDAIGPTRGDFEAGDAFIVDQQVNQTDDINNILEDVDLNLGENPLEAPSAPAVASFNDDRDITVNNTALSADVTEDRVVVAGAGETLNVSINGTDIDAVRASLDDPDTIQTSAVGVNVSNTTLHDVTIANSFVGDHTAVDTTGDSVVTSGGASVTIENSTLAPSTVNVSTIEEPTETTNTLLFDSIEGFDADADSPPTAPVGVNAGTNEALTVSASDVTGHPGDGVLVNGTEVDVVLNESTTVTDSGARGVDVASGGDLTINNTAVSNSTDIGVDVRANVDLNITEATIEDGSATGVLLDATLAGAEISQTTIANNTAPNATADGLRLTEFVDAPNVTVRANAFENNDFGIVVEEGDTGTETLDATLNYFGDRNGPAAADGDSVTENVVYDPFLSADRTGTSPAAIESTTGFAHDVIVPATDGERTFVAVGFPAQLEGVGINDTTTVDDYIDPSYDGNVYAFFQSNNSFSSVSGDRKIEAFDALVVENPPSEDRDRVISLEYADDRNPTALPDNRLTYDEGLNFVAPQQAGQVDEVLFPGGDTDAVIQPFPAGENLYGAASADQVRDQFVTVDGAQEVSTNFRSGAGDATVHPHVGYFAVVNENTNNGLTVVESIPVPDSPTADEIANRTDANSDVVVTNAVTGATFESLTAALSEANDFETLVLERGTFAQNRDSLTITQENLRIVGQGPGQTEIAANITIAGRSSQIDATAFVEASPTGGITVDAEDVSLNAVTAERGIDIQADGTTVTESSASSISVSANDTTITNSSASSITVDASDTTITGGSADSVTISNGTSGVSISNTQTTNGITDNSGNAAVSDISPADGTAVIAENGSSFDSIQAAVDAAGSDQTVRVGAGTFNESVTIDTDNDGLTLEGADGADATTIVGAGAIGGPDATIQVDDGSGPVRNVTMEGFTVENPNGKFGIFAGTGTTNANNDGIGGLVIRDNVVQDVSTQSSGSALTGGPAGIGIRADYGTDGNPGIEISNNEIDNVQGNAGAEPVGITLKSFTGDAGFGFDSTGATVTDAASPPATDTDIRNNEISDITSVDGGFATKGISVSGEFEDVDIIGNSLTGINGTTDGDARAITLSENGDSYSGNQYDIDGDGNGERIGPQDFDIRNNEISDVTGDARSINLGGYEVFGDHTVSQNTINDGAVTRFAGNQPGFQPGDGDALNLVDNTFTSQTSQLYVSDGSQSADLTTVLNDNTFNAAVEVVGAQIRAEGTAPADTVVNLDSGQTFTGGSAVQDAVDVAGQGDTIRVGPGEFQGPVQVTDGQTNLTMRSADGTGNTVINATDGSARSTPSFNAQAVRISVDGVTIDGFNIVGDDTIVSGVFVAGGDGGGDNVRVVNNIIEGMSRPGFGGPSDNSAGIVTAAFGGGGPEVVDGFVARNNTIRDIGSNAKKPNNPGDGTRAQGISLIDIAGDTAGDGAVIENNTISGLAGQDTTTGIAVQPLDRPTNNGTNLDPGVVVRGNDISDADIGLALGDEDALEIANNTFPNVVDEIVRPS
jgi:hypothetical protein